jgi:hypothetical protein
MNGYMSADHTAVTDHGILVDYGEGTNAYVLADNSGRMNNGGFMYTALRHYHRTHYFHSPIDLIK